MSEVYFKKKEFWYINIKLATNLEPGLVVHNIQEAETGGIQGQVV